MNTEYTRSNITSRVRRESGVAVLAVVYGLSVFSVLALSLLKDAALENRLRTAKDPDLHVVLYAGGAGSGHVVSRLNLPTILRREERKKDLSTEVRVPSPVGLDLTGELAAGWAYAVRLSATERVCCDGGDGACAQVKWDEEIAQGSVAPGFERPIRTSDTNQKLEFKLESSSVPDNVTIDPNAAVGSAFLLRATRVPAGSGAAASTQGTDMPMTCKLESGGLTMATGSLHIQPGADEHRAVNRVKSGTVDLEYRSPAAER
jgi:hypothetical protein